VGLTQRVDRELRTRLPKPAYHLARRTYYDARKLTGRNPGRGRLLPDFLVIGTAKSGTTTLHGWLSEHPFVEPAVKKEVHFFDYDWYRGVDWYRQHFPSRRDRDAFAREHGRPFLTGEASPTYISHEWAPGRIRKLLPHAKLIVAFRNPVDRAYSQFQMSRREDEEPFESFADAVAAEESRLRPEHERQRREPRYNSWPLGCWSYLWRSSYAEQIERWLTLFPREQFHFVATEGLEAEPQKALDDVYAFLDLPPYANADLAHRHVAPRYDPMPPDVRARLAEYFRPRNERLYELVGIDFGWDG
jgi:Sulfotransferase domain